MQPTHRDYVLCGHGRPRTRGLFITLEGGDGAGKTTQHAALTQALTAAGYPLIATREPGGSPLGQHLRALVLDPPTGPDGNPVTVTPQAEALIFAADRAQHVADIIAPALDAGLVVLCDRYIGSSVAYQGFGRALGATTVEDLSGWATGGLTPDLTLMLDLTVDDGLARAGREVGPDRFETAGNDFHQATREGYAWYARAHRDTVVRIDASGSVEQVTDRLLSVLLPRLAAAADAGLVERNPHVAAAAAQA